MGDEITPGPGEPAAGTRLADPGTGVSRPDQTLAGRYGSPSADHRTRRRLLLGALFAGFVTVVAVLAYDYATPGLSYSLTSYQLGADHRSVSVRFTVHKPKDRAVTCVVEATDRDHNPVGRTEVRFGPGAADLDRTVLLRTTATPDNGQLGDCSLDS
jgi:hypothetical protein